MANGIAADGQTLAGQSSATQAAFLAKWGERAAERWVLEHNAAIGASPQLRADGAKCTYDYECGGGDCYAGGGHVCRGAGSSSPAPTSAVATYPTQTPTQQTPTQLPSPLAPEGAEQVQRVLDFFQKNPLVTVGAIGLGYLLLKGKF